MKFRIVPKPEVLSLAALVVPRVLDATSMPECVHTGIDILVEVESFLRLGSAALSSHVKCVEEAGVAIMKLSIEPR